MQFDIPYLSRDLPGVGGRLRASPEHFVVEELPLYEPVGEGQHLYVNITKRGKTTKDVQRELARLFGIRIGQVGFAGLKDKHACTTQTFSLDLGPNGQRDQEELIAGATDRIQESDAVEVNWARFHRNKLKPGHLLGNRFRVAVSDLDVSGNEADRRAQAIAELVRTEGLPNLFGPQRFGNQGRNVERGLAILHGENVSGDRWLRKFLVSAYQSYLCNAYLALRLEQGLFACVVEGDIAKKYATGGMFEVADLAIDQQRYQDKEISFTAPIFGPKMWACTGRAAKLEAQILDSQSISMPDFERVRTQGTRRLGRLLVPDISVTIEHDMLVLQFSLPKGAFATTVVREFTKARNFEDIGIDDEA